MSGAATAPVLFLIFNRPETTAPVMERIRAARPPRLYVAGDGPRADRPDDPARIAEARRIATAADWPCKVQTRFLDSNAGMRAAVTGALDWFFALEPEGIVLEDDMLPCPGFFRFVTELLERYREDPRIGAVCGANLAGAPPGVAESYFFSRHLHGWGWGSWARMWSRRDPDLASWPEPGLVERAVGGRWFARRHFRRLFDEARAGTRRYFTSVVLHTLWRGDGLCVTPTHSMVGNIGFGMDSVNTPGPMHGYMRRMVPRDPVFPLIHPPRIEARHDRFVERRSLRIGPLKEVKRALWPLFGPTLRRLRGDARPGRV